MTEVTSMLAHMKYLDTEVEDLWSDSLGEQFLTPIYEQLN